MQLNYIEIANQMASSERFQYYELYMFENYKDYWINHCELKTMKCALPVLQVRKEVLTKLTNVSTSFRVRILEKFYFYEKKKGTIPYANPLEKDLNDRAMDNMAKIYAKHFMNPMMDEVKKLKKILPMVNDHYTRFTDLCSKPSEDVKTKTDSLALVRDIHDTRRKLNHLLFHLSTESYNIVMKIQDLTAEGKNIGPAFQTNPVIYLLGAPLILSKGCKYCGQEVEKTVKVIERIKQEKSVLQGIEPFYLLFLNSVQALRKMEKGMGAHLDKYFHFEAGFSIHNRPDPLFQSDRNFSLRSFDKTKGRIGIQFDRENDISETTETPNLEALNVKPIDLFLLKIDQLLTCPLTKKRFNEPATIETGYTFEQDSINEYLRIHDDCPITHKKLDSKEVIRNLAFKSIIKRFESCDEHLESDFFTNLSEFESSISLEPFQKPTLVSTGMSYDLIEVEVLMREGNTCPLTRGTLNPKIKVPNLVLVEMMKLVSETKINPSLSNNINNNNNSSKN